MMEFLFNQPNAEARVKWVRVSLCWMVIFLLLLGPYDDFYVKGADWFFKAQQPFPWFPNLENHFFTLKYFTVIFALCNALNIQRWVTGPLFAVSFLFFNFYVTCFGTTYWITNTHLNIFALILLLDRPNNKEMASFIVAFMTTYISALYFQAGLSKLLLGGVDWFIYGERIWTETILLGTPFGKWLTQWPWIFRGLGIGTAVFELMMPVLFFFSATQPYVAFMALLFHLGTFVVMGISFWFLWALFPALFFIKREFFTTGITESKEERK